MDEAKAVELDRARELMMLGCNRPCLVTANLKDKGLGFWARVTWRYKDAIVGDRFLAGFSHASVLAEAMAIAVENGFSESEVAVICGNKMVSGALAV